MNKSKDKDKRQSAGHPPVIKHMINGHPDGLVSNPVWPTRSSSLPTYNGHSIKRKPVAVVGKDGGVVTVAISGCSSSGKTMVSVMLAQIFSIGEENVRVLDDEDEIKAEAEGPLIDISIDVASEEHVKPELNGEKKGEAKLFIDVDQGIVIHQDAYFLEKFYCPLTTFTSTAADVSFMKKTLADDQIDAYIISPAGSTKNCNSSSSAAEVAGCCPYDPVWQITGPDTDCWSALDIPSLNTTLQSVKRRRSFSETSVRREDEQRIKLPGFLLTSAQRDALIAPHTALIAELKNKVKEWNLSHAGSGTDSGSQGLHIRDALAMGRNDTDAIHPKLVFVEGFLLFPDPESAHISNEEKVKSDKNKENFYPFGNDLGSQNGTTEKRTALEMATEHADTFQTINAHAKAKLMSNFDIKLFLPLSKDQSKERRFARDCYVDAPEGMRVPGQMWKTDGYFEDVAWANYVKECGWLFEGGDVQAGGEGDEECVASVLAEKHGVHVRPGLDAGVEETVRWAVEKILGELGKRFDSVETEESAVQAKEEVEHERDFEDHAVHEAEGETEVRAKKNIICVKIIGLKDRLVALVTNKAKVGSSVTKTSTPSTKRHSVFSMRKGKWKPGDFMGVGTRAEGGTQRKKGDIGLKTVLGSANLDKGVFTPKV